MVEMGSVQLTPSAISLITNTERGSVELRYSIKNLVHPEYGVIIIVYYYNVVVIPGLQ